MVCGLRRLLKVIYLVLEIFKMLLLSFSECSLGGPILRFTFLFAKSDPSHGGQVISMLTVVGSDVKGLRPGFLPDLSSLSLLLPPPSSSSLPSMLFLLS